MSTTLPLLDKCACGHVRGDHVMTSGRSLVWDVPQEHGQCRYCECRKFTPAREAA